MEQPVLAAAEPANPFAARAYVFTVITPDLDASIRFYQEVMGNVVIDEGVLPAQSALLDGAPQESRNFVLLRHTQKGIGERGVIRLLAAPLGAAANRPRPDTGFMEPGLGVIECHTSDYEAAYEHMRACNVRTVSSPQYYFRGDPNAPFHSTTSYSAFGPAGEQMLISCQNIPNVYRQKRPVEFPGLFGPITAHSLMCYSRWPSWAFYENVFGLTNIMDRVFQHEPINMLCGLPTGTYYAHSLQGSNVRMELWEFLQFGPPTKEPPFPSHLDRTGFAMTTFIVDDLTLVRARAVESGLQILGEGALPTPEARSRDGFYIRGAVGELIEVIGRH